MELVKDMLKQALKMKLLISQELEAQDIQELQIQKCPLNFNQIANLDNNNTQPFYLLKCVQAANFEVIYR